MTKLRVVVVVAFAMWVAFCASACPPGGVPDAGVSDDVNDAGGGDEDCPAAPPSGGRAVDDPISGIEENDLVGPSSCGTNAALECPAGGPSLGDPGCECNGDTDCCAGEACRESISGGSFACETACFADEDCTAGSVCSCDDLNIRYGNSFTSYRVVRANSCVAAACAGPADCDGRPCRFSPGTGFACTTPDDVCAGPDDCAAKETCLFNGTLWACGPFDFGQ